MKIRELSWSNYRRLPDGRVAVRNHLVLVGPNDSGKSSILRALHLCLGMPHGQLAAAIELRDFTDPDRPLQLSVSLRDIEDHDRAAFPDEISTSEPESLIVSVEATIDPTDTDQKIVRRFFPDGGHARAPSKDQLATIGWAYVPAARSLLRELGGTGGGAVRSLLSAVDLSADDVAFAAAATLFRDTLDGSTALTEFRSELANALSTALPEDVSTDDLRIASEADILNDPLAGVTVTIRDGDHNAPLAEQSDGVRALSVLTLLGMSQRSARIIGVDEPETHLHPSAQRAVARSMRSRGGQRVLVTHSPSVVSEMEPLDIVILGADRRARQLPEDAHIAEFEATTRHWSPQLIEPLTARGILLIEGPSDRILCDRVAAHLGLDLNRAGLVLFELGGSALFATAYKLFGTPGFGLPMYGLLDEDARSSWAAELGVAASDLEAEGYVVCDPDLEGVYLSALGVERVIAMLLASPAINEESILSSCGVTTLADVTEEILWNYCRHKKRKVRAALAVAAALDEPESQLLAPVCEFLRLPAP